MKKNHPFEKFATRKKNSAIKEEFRQEKRKIKKERAERIELQKQARRAAAPQGQAAANQAGGRNAPARPAIVKKVAEQMPLNKYIAHCGVCSRRDAVEFIKEGKVKVNDVVILEPGHKLADNDEVKLSGKKLFPARNLVYILLNKPKDYITTSEDTHGRKTVLDLVKGATTERIYPIGRLDRNTTGVLLLTNDGELTQKLSHPSFEVRKMYEVRLDKPLTKAHFDRIIAGITLEDGPVNVDALAYADATDRSIVGIELHSGRNRIVRRIFESMGYDVRNLDRVLFGNLTKKNVERGKWRFLKEKEIRLLKFMNSSFTRKSKVED
jgi:23S rRNA pseudouridine2605 synthase